MHVAAYPLQQGHYTGAENRRFSIVSRAQQWSDAHCPPFRDCGERGYRTIDAWWESCRSRSFLCFAQFSHRPGAGVPCVLEHAHASC